MMPTKVGVVSAAQGETSITFSSEVPYLDQYVCIKIDDGINSEIHQINVKNLFTFDDVGEMKGFRPINELYQLTTLIMDKAVSFPLVVMKPHVVIKEKSNDIINLSFFITINIKKPHLCKNGV